MIVKRHVVPALAAMLLATGVAEARDLRGAPAGPPAHPANSHLYQNMAKFLPEESDGRLSMTILGPEVVSLGQMKDALQSQLAEVGNMLPLYFPAELPNMALTGELALSGRLPQAMAAAVTEYTVTCESCIEEMKNFGVIYLGSGSSDVYLLMTTRPVHTAQDLSGMRLRSGGAPFSRWAENFDAVPISIGVGEQFESLSQGVIDGTMGSIADALSFRLIELISHVTVLPMGTYHATSNFATALSTWESLSVEDREAMARAGNRANALFTQRWGHEMPTEAQAAIEEAGIEVIEADPAFVEAVEAFAVADQESVVRIATEQYGFTDAQERVDRFNELVEKWTAIVEEVDNDPVRIAERVDEEVWSKVDFSTYGL